MKNQISNFSAEKALLCACLLDDSKQAIDTCLFHGVSDSTFVNPTNIKIWQSIVKRYRNNDNIDSVTIMNEIPIDISIINDIETMPVNSNNLVDYIKKAKEYENRRYIVIEAKYMSLLANDLNNDIMAEIKKFNLKLEALEINKKDTFQSLSDIGSVLEDIDKNIKNENQLLTGFSTLDSYLGSLRRGELIIIGARPSVGKTAFMLNIAYYLGKYYKKVGIISLEMSYNALVKRLLHIDSGVNISWVEYNKDSSYNENIITSANILARLPIYITDCFDLSIIDIRNNIKNLYSKYDIDILFIDYLGLVKTEKELNKQQRYVQVGEISRGLKNLAKEINIPIIALHQLNREIEKTKRKPTLADLRESGSIEQDADIVILLSNKIIEEKKIKGMIEDKEEIPDNIFQPLIDIDLQVAKNRHGRTGDVPFIFNKEKQRFNEIINREEF